MVDTKDKTTSKDRAFTAPDASATTGTKNSPYDREFRQATSNFMRGVEDRLRHPSPRYDGKPEMDMDTDAGRQLEGLLNKANQELLLLSKNDEKQKDPKDHALGIAMVARDLADSSYFFRHYTAGADKATVAQMRVAFAEGKTRLLATGEKLWPELKIKPDKTKPFAKISEAINAVGNFIESDEFNGKKLDQNSATEAIKKGKAAELLFTLDRMIEEVGDYVGMEAQSTYNHAAENIGSLAAEEKSTRRETIAAAMRGLCELIQIRDVVDVEHNDGGYAHPPDEVEQIDAARAKAEKAGATTSAPNDRQSGGMTEDEIEESRRRLAGVKIGGRPEATTATTTKTKEAAPEVGPTVEQPILGAERKARTREERLRDLKGIYGPDFKGRPAQPGETPEQRQLREKERELLEKILAVAVADIGDFPERGDFGHAFQDKNVNTPYIFRMLSLNSDRAVVDPANEINEGVAVAPMTRNIVENRPVVKKVKERKKGFFGGEKIIEVEKTVDEPTVVGVKKVMFSEMAGPQSGPDASAEAYCLKLSSMASGVKTFAPRGGRRPEESYIDYGICLPKNLATDAMDLVKRDPKFMRQICMAVSDRDARSSGKGGADEIGNDFDRKIDWELYLHDRHLTSNMVICEPGADGKMKVNKVQIKN